MEDETSLCPPQETGKEGLAHAKAVGKCYETLGASPFSGQLFHQRSILFLEIVEITCLFGELSICHFQRGGSFSYLTFQLHV